MVFRALFCFIVGGRGQSLLGVSLVAQNLPAISGDTGDCRFNPWVGKIPLEEGMATHPSVLAGRILMDREAWWGYCPWGRRRVRQD